MVEGGPDPARVAASLGFDPATIRRLEEQGHLGALALDEAEIAQRLYRAYRAYLYARVAAECPREDTVTRRKPPRAASFLVAALALAASLVLAAPAAGRPPTIDGAYSAPTVRSQGPTERGGTAATTMSGPALHTLFERTLGSGRLYELEDGAPPTASPLPAASTGSAVTRTRVAVGSGVVLVAALLACAALRSSRRRHSPATC
jgi:hypothetical protein